MTAELPLRALRKALASRGIPERLMAHSDQGSQFRSRAYQKELRAHGITCSMSRRANCHDNSPMESFFASIKKELDLSRCVTREQVELEVFQYIEAFYNRQRLHSSLGYQSPEEFEWNQANSQMAKQRSITKYTP